ncbi:uncharacterized protein B4U80_12659, partial [Leptotrombidium deliense]
MPEQINRLEKAGTDIDIQLRIVDETLGLLDGFEREKLQKCLDKNPDINWVRKPTVDGEIDLDSKHLIRYLPLVSVDVERSFSKYKCLLTERRHRLSKKNIEMFLFLQYNADLEDSNVDVEGYYAELESIT